MAQDNSSPGTATGNTAEKPPETAKSPDKAQKDTPKENKKFNGTSALWKSLVVILLALIFGTAGGAAAWYYIMDSQQENASENTEEEEASEDSSTSEQASTALLEYTGNTFTANLPDGWSIQEYYNGNGTDMLVTGPTYTGLTGLEILNPGDEVVFKMKAVNGIGGVDACQNYFEFPDNSTTYYNEKLASSQAVGVTPTIVTIASGTYTEFDFLGKSFRRVNDDLYWDTIDGNSYFEAACGMDYAFMSFDGLTFGIDSSPGETYEIAVFGSPTASELETLEDILASLEVIP